jgi:hypothetical protein
MMISRFGLGIARLASAAWVGAALLFVVTAVREVRDPIFNSTTKDSLALDRFPAYYAFGFALVSLALVGAVAAMAAGGRSIRVAAALLGVALAVMIGDFVSVYRPLLEMVDPPGRAKPADFEDYHRRSMGLNTFNVGLCAVAALLLCWHHPSKAGGAVKPAQETVKSKNQEEPQ